MDPLCFHVSYRLGTREAMTRKKSGQREVDVMPSFRATEDFAPFTDLSLHWLLRRSLIVNKQGG